MRIALATDWWPPRVGGVESQVSDLAAALAARGHDVRVLTTTPRPASPPSASPCQVEPLEVPRLGKVLGDVAVPDLRRVPELAERIKAHAPDVVHAHGMFSSLAIGAIIAADRLGLPSVLTVHSLLRPPPVLAAAAAVFRLFANRATILTSVSAAAAADVARASGRPAAEVLQIANGLTLADWSPPRGRSEAPGGSGRGSARSGGLSPRNERIRIAAVTRLARKKRPLDLVRALSRARHRFPLAQAHLDIAGDGPARAALESEATRLGVRDRITFHGDCSRADVRRLLAEASLLAHPGTNEAFGLAVLEARASGVPVVAMAAGGLPELIDHGRHGLLARTRGEFYEFVARMTADAELRRRCASEAVSNLEVYDWSRVVLLHEAAYATAAGVGHTNGRQVKNSVAATI